MPVASVEFDQSALIEAVRAGDRRALAKTITLLESTRSEHRLRADAVLDALLPFAGAALRLGISGVPGVGKSTFIEALGVFLIERGHKVAVLAIDPSSGVSGGSILGDKTRMEKLSMDERAYIRPSPSSGTLGGVAEKTREAMLVCEAAGYDVVIIETVGVGQSETTVAGMTDMFVLLQLPNAGDDLQAMKKGIMEMADLIVINKADLDPDAAMRAEAQITSALRVLRFTGAPGSHDEARWQTRVMRGSALRAEGLADFWRHVETFRELRSKTGDFTQRRRQQALTWMWDQVNARLIADFRAHPGVQRSLPQVLSDIDSLRIAPSSAARKLLNIFENRESTHA
jgi:LAO/AO transport system kinase